jgi:hypothetical protein
MADFFAEALAHDAAAPLPPLELVALVAENTDLLRGGDAGQALASRLADRLVALDLPRRAVPCLRSSRHPHRQDPRGRHSVTGWRVCGWRRTMPPARWQPSRRPTPPDWRHRSWKRAP